MAIVLIGILMLASGFYFHYREKGPWARAQRLMVAGGIVVILIGVYFLARHS